MAQITHLAVIAGLLTSGVPAAAKNEPPAAASKPEPAAAAPSPGEIVAQASSDEWVRIAPKDLLVMNLAADGQGKARQVIIQLMPPPFSQGWIDNIRKLAATHWWDGTSINRVQDNYVAQWGDASEKKPLPAGLATVPESEYTISSQAISDARYAAGFSERDSYAQSVGFIDSWPLASNNASSEPTYWPVHCYGAVGVGRNYAPDTGSGAELYAVIGHAPRHLDRNIAVVGRVVEGIEYLSSLPRGSGPLDFYETEAERVTINSIRLASELPTAQQPQLEYLSSDGATFARYVDARANRRDPFFIQPAGGVDICNVPVPVRRVRGK